MSRFFLQTFGCRCNQADSAAIRDGLCRVAMREAASASDADLVVVNTCTVTQRTDQQVRQAVRKAHRENPGARLVVTGCYAERDPDSLADLPGVHLVVGNGARDRLVEILAETPPQVLGRIIRTPLEPAADCPIPPASRIGSRTRPLVKIQDGCDARCSYCIVPSVRGPGKSARPESILSEIGALIDAGYQEIVLTGVHLGTYGRRLDNPVKLAGLLRRIVALPGLGRIRLSSIEPMLFDRAIVHLAAENPVLAPHFHIPLQSGSDRVLRRMRRPYSASRFMDLLDFIRSSLPTAGLGTDVLVGFPGETDEDFRQTCDAVRKAPLTYLHVFPFSPREGTAASTLPQPVPPNVVRERARLLREISAAKNLAFRRGFLGKTVMGITLSKEEEMGESAVLTENYVQVRVTPPIPAPNRLVSVRIEEVTPQITRAGIV